MSDVLDLVLRGAAVVTEYGTTRVDIGISGGVISAMVTPGTPLTGQTEVDLDGLTLLPGGVDTHTHLREPGYTQKEDITTGTQAAAAGGYTTVFGMPNVQPPTNTVERYREAIGLYATKSLVDFNHNPSPTIIEEIPGLAEAGAAGFKIYMIADTGRDYPHIPGIGVHDHGQLFEIAEAVAETGRPLMVHPHDQELMRVIENRFWDRGERDHRAYAKAFASYEGLVWDSATSFLIRLQEASAVKMHILHVKTPRMAAIIRAAKERGVDVTAELNPIAVFLCNEWESIERFGPYALSTWTGPDATEPLWEALRDGTIDLIGSDHAPHTREEKEIGWTDMWKAAGGVPQIQHSLPLFLTEVNEGRISLGRLAELMATNPAKRFGIYPQKGSIQVGADADLVAVDLRARDVIRESDVLSKCGWTPFDGREVHGIPIHTLVRGTFVMKDRKIVGSPGYGRQAVPGKALVAAPSVQGD